MGSTHGQFRDAACGVPCEIINRMNVGAGVPDSPKTAVKLVQLAPTPTVGSTDRQFTLSLVPRSFFTKSK